MIRGTRSQGLVLPLTQNGKLALPMRLVVEELLHLVLPVPSCLPLESLYLLMTKALEAYAMVAES